MTQSPPTVLVVEDDLALRATIVESLEASGFAAAQASDAADAIERLQGFAYDGLVVDLKLPDADGMTVLDEALARYPLIRAVVITGFGGVEEAVTAIRRGAVDFLIKPFQLSQLSRVLRTGLEQLRLREENASLKAQLHERFRFDNVIGRHRSVQTLFSTLELVAPMNSTVLIQGETGTGKELVARTIHHNSPRAEQRFVAFNAAAIPEPLAEAELFGHVKGAFTGAIANRPGRFELAHRGTLFIDEVASMSGSCAPPIATSARRCARGASARISTTGSTSFRSGSWRCGSGARTSRRSWRTFCWRRSARSTSSHPTRSSTSATTTSRGTSASSRT